MDFRNVIVLLFSMLFIACGDAATNLNTSNANTNGAISNANNPLAVRTPTPEETTNNAPTLTPVYKAYCEAMVKRDEAALRRIYSKDTIEYFEKEMKADGEKSLMKYIEDENVTLDLCEARNETITGNEAIAEIRTKGYPNGIKVVFVKEGNEWKLTNRSPEIDSVEKDAPNPSGK